MDKEIETIALVGLGALGTAYLGKIAETVAMDAIQVVAEGDRARRYREKGVGLNGRRLFFPVAGGDELRPADLLIFTVKYNQLHEAIRLARGAVGPETIVLSLLNGITSEQVIADAYGAYTVLYSLSLGIDATRHGDDTRLTVFGFIPFGEAVNRPDGYGERVLRVRRFFDRVGLKYEIPDNMIRALWQKFMLNVGVNQTSAVLETAYGALQRPGEARNLAVSAMREVVQLAEYEAVELHEADIDRALEIIGTLSPQGKCSMLQDIEARRPTEVAIFGGTVLELANKHGVAVPVNAMLVRIIRAKEEMNALGKGSE